MYVSIVHRLLDLVAPRTCCVCEKRLAVNEEMLCASCVRHLPWTDFIDNTYENELAKLFWGRIKHFEKAFAPIYYIPRSLSARPIYQLKYFHKSDLGIDMGLMMGKMLKTSGFFDDIDYILPVPLAKKRRRERGYNQSEMIAEGLCSVSCLPMIKDAVIRVAFNGSQTKKDKVERSENVENAFKLINDKKLKGKHILIVDDIVTTGATVCAVAKQLECVSDVKISVAALGYTNSR